MPRNGAEPTSPIASKGQADRRLGIDPCYRNQLNEWLSWRVLTVTSSGTRVTYTWDQFLRSYAEKWGGAHLDPTVPPHLQTIDHHSAGGLPLSNYLLRSAGVHVWEMAQTLYRGIFRGLSRTNRDGVVVETPDAQLATYNAPGGVGSVPRDISSRGTLLEFCHRNGSVQLTWYVDDSGSENALQLTLGSVPYDLRYSAPGVPVASEPVAVQRQRQLDRSSPIKVAEGSLKQVLIAGVVRTLADVRAAGVAQDADLLSTAGPT